MGQMKRQEKREEEAGKASGALCSRCCFWLGTPDRPGPRWCAKCRPATMTRCYMRFEQMLGLWHVTVLRDGHRVRELKFADESKVEEMARRGGGLRDLASKQALEIALREGRGGCELLLTNEQFARLQR